MQHLTYPRIHRLEPRLAHSISRSTVASGVLGSHSTRPIQHMPKVRLAFLRWVLVEEFAKVGTVSEEAADQHGVGGAAAEEAFELFSQIVGRCVLKRSYMS